MSSGPKLNFSEKVKAIGKKKDVDLFDVIFKTRAAFYWIKADRGEEITLLQDSAKNNSPVNITCHALTREILEVSC
jgi:hypothetical protein